MTFSLTSIDLVLVIGIVLLSFSIIVPIIYNVFRHLDDVFREDYDPLFKDRKMLIYKSTILLFILLGLVNFNIFIKVRDFF